MLQPQVFYDIKTTNNCAENYLRRLTHMAHNTKKQNKIKHIVKKTKTEEKQVTSQV